MEKSKSTLLPERLHTLLTERRALRPLFARYQLFLNARRFNAERSAIERQIAATVIAELHLEPFELERLPQPGHIAECAFHLRTSFSTTRLFDPPGLVWGLNPFPGVMTDNWHPALKQRLLDLVGPLDDILTRMLS